MKTFSKGIVTFLGIIALGSLYLLPVSQAAISPAMFPVIEIEPLLDLDYTLPEKLQELPLPTQKGSVDASPDAKTLASLEANIVALEILEQAYQEYLLDIRNGYKAVDAQDRLVNTLMAVGFKAQSADNVLKSLEESKQTYPIPGEIKTALRKISKL